MSLIDKFSVAYSIEKSKKKKRENYESTVKTPLNNDERIKKEFLTQELLEPLLNFGFNISQIMKAYKIYKFTTVDEAIYFLMRDPETKKFNHRFICGDNKNVINSDGFNKGNQELCFLCNEKIEEHIFSDLEDKEYRAEEQFEENRNHFNYEIKDTTINMDKSNMVLKTTETGLIEKKLNFMTNQIKNIEIPKSNLDLFEDPNICTICYDEVLGESNSFKFTCGHMFCKSCVTHHLEVNINSGKVLMIKCLYGGCPKTFLEEEIRQFVSNELLLKFKKFKVAQMRLINQSSNYINCPYPDCEDLIDYTQDNKESMIECAYGHQFCAQCKTLGWHKVGKCKSSDNFLLRKLQKDRNGINYKQCPRCSIIIEKNEGCNQMRCVNCDFEFCWLCMRKYSRDHYAMYNFTGCPGLRFKSAEKDTLLNSKLLKCLWFLSSILLGILAFISIILFFVLFGCAYEFVKCYLNDSKSETEDVDLEMSNYANQRDFEQNQQPTENTEKNNCKKKTIIAILITLGLLCQPFYLIFYILYAFMECSKRFGCWFYYSDM